MPPTLTLPGGVRLPQLGFGTWPLDDDAAERAARAAVACGYRLFDTAARYGNERGVGRALRDCGVDRAALFVTTKLRGRDHGYDAALRGFDDSAARLGLDHVDLLLIHWPLPAKDLYVQTWRAFLRLLADGRVRAIGVSNFTPAHLTRLIDETGTVPAVNQIQLHPGLTRPGARAFHRAHGILTQSWSPLGRGGSLLREPLLAGLAGRHGRTVAQIVLRWHVQSGLSVVPRSANPDRIAENIDVFDFMLTSEDMAAIATLDCCDEGAADPDVIHEE